jgi:dethiobiotin synthetase
MTETIFITGTGTDVGKTFVTRLMIQQLKAAGKTVRAYKPIISGVSADNIASSDTGLILKALGEEITEKNIDKISPWRFKEPLSPHDAARLEGREIDFEDLIHFTQKIQKEAEIDQTDYLLIEAVGGIMVPLNYEKTILDWIATLKCEVMLVTGNYLGVLSHCLTTIFVVNTCKIRIKKLVISCHMDKHSIVEADDTHHTLSKLHPEISIMVLPKLESPTNDITIIET